jgi:hypothetical protein
MRMLLQSVLKHVFDFQDFGGAQTWNVFKRTCEVFKLNALDLWEVMSETSWQISIQFGIAGLQQNLSGEFNSCL